MSSEQNLAKSESGNDQTSRRRLIGLLGAAGAATVVTGIAAPHSDAANEDPLLVGNRDNEATDITVLRADVPTTSLIVVNDYPDGTPFTITGSSKHGVGVQGRCEEGTNPGIAAYSAGGPAAYFSTDTGDAIHANGYVGIGGTRNGHLLTVNNQSTDPGGGGVSAVCSGSSNGTSAVFGASLGAGIGVWGRATSGDGLQGYSESGHGIWASSITGNGAHFTSESGTALVVQGTAHMSGAATEFVLGVDNNSEGGDSGGIYATSRGGKPAIEGDALPSAGNPGVGVQGVSGADQTFGQGPGIGVEGITGTGVGVHAQATAGGYGLRVDGKSALSTAGSVTLPSGASSVFVSNSNVTAHSHVSVTVASNPGPRQVAWVDRDPGNGFTVNMTSAPAKQRPATSLTYLIVEPT